MSFVAVWLALLAALPTHADSTLVGTMIGKGFEAFGAALVLWSPVAGITAAMKWHRRKTH